MIIEILHKGNIVLSVDMPTVERVADLELCARLKSKKDDFNDVNLNSQEQKKYVRDVPQAIPEKEVIKFERVKGEYSNKNHFI